MGVREGARAGSITRPVEIVFPSQAAGFGFGRVCWARPSARVLQENTASRVESSKIVPAAVENIEGASDAAPCGVVGHQEQEPQGKPHQNQPRIAKGKTANTGAPHPHGAWTLAGCAATVSGLKP